MVSTTVLLLHLGSCSDPAIIDRNYNPGSTLNLSTLDTFTAYISTSQETNPLPSSGSTVAAGLIGNITDDTKFGKVYTGLYTQLILPTLAPKLDTGNMVLDSIVLILPYSTYYHRYRYGKSTGTGTVQVYELSQDMNQTATYHLQDAFGVRIPAIGTKQITQDNAYFAANIRVPLDKTYFGNKLFHASTADLADNLAFVKLFKGIYITANGSWNAVHPIDISNTRIRLFYHNATVRDSFSLTTSGYTAHSNHIDHSYLGADIQQAFGGAISDKAYIQCGGGARVNLSIPGLSSLPKSDSIVINRVLVDIPTDHDSISTGYDSAYTPPGIFDVYAYDNAGGLYAIPNDHPVSKNNAPAYTLGIIKTKEGKYYYRIDLTTYVQGLIKGKYVNKGLVLQASSTSLTFSNNQNVDRAVLLNSGTSKIKVQVLYTKIK
jgi:hypothetical protein